MSTFVLQRPCSHVLQPIRSKARPIAKNQLIIRRVPVLERYFTRLAARKPKEHGKQLFYLATQNSIYINCTAYNAVCFVLFSCARGVFITLDTCVASKAIINTSLRVRKKYYLYAPMEKKRHRRTVSAATVLLNHGDGKE
jgi:hypothetical protein